MQAMPSSGYLPDSWPAASPLYVSKHNPFILYNDVRSDPRWRDHIQPYQNMTADLNGPNPPRYVWISPDLCNDMHGGVTAKIKGFPETPCPYSNVAGDHNDELLKAKADAFVKQAVHTITTSRAWTGNSVIFVTADESDYDGSDAADNYYLSTAGCCDSPYLPAGDPEISAKWPGGLYGGGSAPMIVISRTGPRHVTDATPPITTPCCSPSRRALGCPSSATPATPARCIRSGGSSSATTDLDGVWMAGKPLPGQLSRHIARVT
jgi:hypothetical protein